MLNMTSLALNQIGNRGVNIMFQQESTLVEPHGDQRLWQLSI